MEMQGLTLKVTLETDGYMEKAAAVAEANADLGNALESEDLEQIAEAWKKESEALQEWAEFITSHTTVTRADVAEGHKFDIYGPPSIDQDFEALMDRVENALGFKLFRWQKTYIERGTFRCYGATTAEILRTLLLKEAAPIDYTRPPRNHKEMIFRRELMDMQMRLGAAGIQTRPVATSRQQLTEYMEKYRKESQRENGCKDFERHHAGCTGEKNKQGI